MVKSKYFLPYVISLETQVKKAFPNKKGKLSRKRNLFMSSGTKKQGKNAVATCKANSNASVLNFFFWGGGGGG